MTKELAELLDGPVAERFGRPDRDGVLVLTPHGWEYGENIGNNTAAALWLAHLLGVCRERKINFTVDNSDTKPDVLLTIRQDSCFGACGGTGDTLLEALARAVLAVPEKP